jgi:O-antigen/teichoic acid export membrane protein
MADSKFANRVMYDGLYTFVVRLLNMLCAAALGILTARLLGPAGKGAYTLPLVEAALVTTAFGGLNSALSYFLLNRRPGPRILIPAFTVGAMYVLVGAIALIPIALLSHHSSTLIPALLALPSGAALSLAGGYAVGTKRVRYSTSITMFVTLLTLILMCVGLFLIARAPIVAIAAWLVANIIIGAVCVAALMWDARRLEGEDGVSTREFLKFSIKVGLVNTVSLLNYRADLYVVALLTTTAELGMYSVAISAAESLQVPTQVATLVTSPHIGSLEVDGAARLAARCVRNNLLVAGAVCGLLFVLAPFVVKLLYGDAFMPVVPALRILLIGVLFLSLGSPMSVYFTLKLGRPDVPLRLAGLSAVICIAMAVLLVPHLSLVGASLASTVAYVAGAIGGIWWFTHSTKLGVRTMLVPTRTDLAQYRGFLVRMIHDGRSLLRPLTSSR